MHRRGSGVRKRVATAKRAVAALLVVLGIVALLPNSPVGADGTETLGTPSITIASGSGVVTEGVGMQSQPANLGITVPANATIKQVLLYWQGLATTSSGPDPTIRVNGTEVQGTNIGGPTVFFSNVASTSYRADITSLGVISPGANNVTLSDLAFDTENDGASIDVIYDDGSGTSDIQVRDGNDNAYFEFAPPLNTTVPQTFTLAASASARNATLSLAVGGIDVNRSSRVRVTVGAQTTDYDNILANTDGLYWDDVDIPLSIPAGVTSVTVQVLSDPAAGPDPASLHWVNAILSTPGPGGGGCPPVNPNVQAITHGSAYAADARLLLGIPVLNQVAKVSTVAPGAPSDQAKNGPTINVLNLVAAQIVATESHSALNPSRSTATAALANVNLLNGLVRATAVRGVSQSVASPNATTRSSAGSAIVGLTVNNNPVVVAPNTSVNVKLGLLTVASLKIYEETGTSTFANGVSKSTHSVNMLRLNILSPLVGTVGTQVILGHAETDAQSPVSSCPTTKSVSGEAFTAFVDGNLAGTDLVDVKVGDAVLPATGGADSDGVVANLPGIVTNATAFNTTTGSLNPNPNAQSRSLVEGVNVLGGLVTATTLDARSSSFANGTTAGTTQSLTFVNLRVAGITVAANVAPNTVIAVAISPVAFATVTLNERLVNSNGTTDTEGTINAVHVRVFTLGGLLTGRVIVASAHSDAHV